MAKRSKSQRQQQRRAKQERRKQRSLVTDKNLSDARNWLIRANENIHLALSLAARMSKEPAGRSDLDLRVALAKYAENVAEAITQLDKSTGGTLLEALVEIPMEGKNDSLTWADLKGMRIRLAHKFWEIDHEIVWQTVTNEFPAVGDLFACVHIADTVFDMRTDEGLVYTFSTDLFKQIKYPLEELGDDYSPGKFIIVALYDRTGGWLLARAGRDKEGKTGRMSFSGSEFYRLGQPIHISLYVR